MKLSDNLTAAARYATNEAHQGFLREAGQQARQLEHSSPEHEVRQAHVKFGTPAPAAPVQDMGSVDWTARTKLMREEFEELMDAIEDRNMVAIISEGCDLIYTVLGTFVVMGVPFRPFWKALCRANMAKVREPGGGKWLKPDGWQPANMHKILYRIRQQSEGVE